MHLTAHAPGRVNLIGDHTDHTGGLVLPMAIDLGVTVQGRPGGDRVELVSDLDPAPAVVPLEVADPSRVRPEWARYVAGVVAELAPATGFRGRVTSTVPLGAGLSSSAALSVAVALALGATGDPVEVARLCQRAEQRSTGVPCGLMDQLVCVAGVPGAALLIDTGSGWVQPVAVPAGAEVVVVHSGEQRALSDSSYAEVRDRCVSGEAVAAAHVSSENRRVRDAAAGLARADLARVGALMVQSHASLAELGVSTPTLDRLVAQLNRTRGVFGARLTGAGFGGCVVALCEPGAVGELITDPDGGAWSRIWRVVPSAGAWLRTG
ncbi:MAG: galactokinase [Acidimicrobiales bacterium]